MSVASNDRHNTVNLQGLDESKSSKNIISTPKRTGAVAPLGKSSPSPKKMVDARTVEQKRIDLENYSLYLRLKKVSSALSVEKFAKEDVERRKWVQTNCKYPYTLKGPGYIASNPSTPRRASDKTRLEPIDEEITRLKAILAEEDPSAHAQKSTPPTSPSKTKSSSAGTSPRKKKQWYTEQQLLTGRPAPLGNGTDPRLPTKCVFRSQRYLQGCDPNTIYLVEFHSDSVNLDIYAWLVGEAPLPENILNAARRNQPRPADEECADAVFARQNPQAAEAGADGDEPQEIEIDDEWLFNILTAETEEAREEARAAALKWVDGEIETEKSERESYTAAFNARQAANKDAFKSAEESAAASTEILASITEEEVQDFIEIAKDWSAETHQKSAQLLSAFATIAAEFPNSWEEIIESLDVGLVETVHKILAKTGGVVNNTAEREIEDVLSNTELIDEEAAESEFVGKIEKYLHCALTAKKETTQASEKVKSEEECESPDEATYAAEVNKSKIRLNDLKRRRATYFGVAVNEEELEQVEHSASETNFDEYPVDEQSGPVDSVRIVNGRECELPPPYHISLNSDALSRIMVICVNSYPVIADHLYIIPPRTQPAAAAPVNEQTGEDQGEEDATPQPPNRLVLRPNPYSESPYFSFLAKALDSPYVRLDRAKKAHASNAKFAKETNSSVLLREAKTGKKSPVRKQKSQEEKESINTQHHVTAARNKADDEEVIEQADDEDVKEEREEEEREEEEEAAAPAEADEEEKDE